MLQFIDYDQESAMTAAKRILELETKLAKPRLDKVESRDVRNFNNPRTLKELNEMTRRSQQCFWRKKRPQPKRHDYKIY